MVPDHFTHTLPHGSLGLRGCHIISLSQLLATFFHYSYLLVVVVFMYIFLLLSLVLELLILFFVIPFIVLPLLINIKSLVTFHIFQ